MKKIGLFILFMVLFQISFSQTRHHAILPFNEDYTDVAYIKVVQVDSTTKASELYLRAKLWLAEAYKSSKDVIQVDDKEAGQIVGKGIVVVDWNPTFYSSVATNVHHTITIQLKDGRYRYEITSLVVKYSMNDRNSVINTELSIMDWDRKLSRPDNTKKYLTSIDEEFKKLVESLEKAMQKPSKKSDW